MTESEGKAPTGDGAAEPAPPPRGLPAWLTPPASMSEAPAARVADAAAGPAVQAAAAAPGQPAAGGMQADAGLAAPEAPPFRLLPSALIPPEPAATRPPAEPVLRRGPRWGLRAGLAIVLLPVAFALIAAIGLIGQEVTAPSWLKDRIEAQAAQALGGGSLRFGEITVTLGRDLHPRVTLREAVLRDAAGAVLARVPMIEALLSPRGLILRREVLPQEITLTGPELALRRNSDGSVAVAFAGAPVAAGQAAGLAGLVHEIEGFFDRGPLAALEQVQVQGLILNYGDARAGRSWTVDGGRMTLDLRGGMTRLRGELSVLSGRAFVTTMRLSYDSPRDSPAAEMAVTVINAAAADIATQSPALAWLAVLDAPISATLRAGVDPAGRFSRFRASLKLGAGALDPVAGADPVGFQSARADLTFEPAAGQITFERISVQSDLGRLDATGQALLTEMRGGWPGALVAQFAVTDLEMNPPGLFAQPLPLGNAGMDMRLRLAPFRLTVGQFVLTDLPAGTAADPAASPAEAAASPAGAVYLSGRAEISAAPEGWSVALDAAMPRMLPSWIARWWPSTLDPGTGLWLAENLTAGQLTDLHLGLRLAPGQPARLAGSHTFADVTVRPMRLLPPITAASGFASYDNGVYAITLQSGQVAAPQGGVIDLAGSALVIHDTSLLQPPATLDLVSDSSITALLSLLDQPPYNLFTAQGVPVDLADGRVEAEGRIELKLAEVLEREDLDYAIRGRLSGVQSDWVVPGRVLSASALAVSVTPDAISIGGPMRLGLVPLTATWSRALGPDSAGTAAAEGTVELSERFIDEFRIGLPPGSVSGAGQASFRLDLGQPGVTGFRLTSDLDGLALALPPLGWAKPAGRSGALTVEGWLGGGAPRIDRLALDAAGLQAEGVIDLTTDGGLAEARFARVRLDGWLDADVTLQGRGAGRAPAVLLAGGTVDLRRAAFGETAGQGGPLTLALDRLQVTEGIALTDFRGSFDASGGFSGDFTAGVNGAATVQGAVVPLNGQSAVRLRSAEAGAVLRAAGFLDRAEGGALDLTLLPAGPEGSYDGTLTIDSLRVRDAPALASLLNAISVVGLLQQMSGQGLVFDRVEAEFRIDPERITVLRSSAVGVGLGLSLDGVYATASREMDFQGVISPFFLINGIGAFLTRPGEGLIGFNFSLVGPVGAPRVGVNPLSVLTPGMFRELFRRPAPELPAPGQ